MSFMCDETSKVNEETLSMDIPSCCIDNLSETPDQNVTYSHTGIISRGRLILYDVFVWDCIEFHLQVVYYKVIKLCDSFMAHFKDV